MVDARHELDTLTEDNMKPLETLLRSEYPSYVPSDESDESGLEEDDGESSCSDDEGSDQVKIMTWFYRPKILWRLYYKT